MKKFLLVILAPLLLSFAILSTSLTAQSKKKTTPTAGNNGTTVLWTMPVKPAQAHAYLNENEFGLKNNLINALWQIKDNRLRLVTFTDVLNNGAVNFAPISLFLFAADSLGTIDSDDFMVTKGPEIINIKPDAENPRVAGHIKGKGITLTLLNKKSGMEIKWEAELRDSSNYIRQIYNITRGKERKTITITSINLFRIPVEYSAANSIGTVPGSPYLIPGTDIIAGIEQPGYLAEAADAGATALTMPTQLVFNAGDNYTISTMMGVFPAEQRRRTFLYYIERERASKSRRYLHYNAWYDLAEDLSEAKLIKVAKSFYDELVKKRGVKLDGFVLDDGWDNPNLNFWVPDSTRFTNGFGTLKKYLDSTSGARLGLWISPCGGYGGQEERIALAKEAGALPPNAKSLDLSYNGYYKLFENLCLNFMKDYGINYFKWDNAAPYENNGLTFGNLKSTAHFMRLCQISADLHKADKNVFINTTVGTWPSPYWLNHVDCTWRMGNGDVNWIGKGDNRERGMNFRDGEAYKMVVKRAPLYPLNSLMFHGVVLGHKYQAKKTSEAGNNMTNEFRSYFALGTNLQELYLSPDLMNGKAWNDLAECIRWNVKHSQILIDTHWVTGDPNKGEPYAYAAWRDNKGVICMRNPDDKPQTITIDIVQAFELPRQSARNYLLKASYTDQRVKSVYAKGGTPFSVTLMPFEVLVFDASGN